jgi:hypothetical protein
MIVIERLHMDGKSKQIEMKKVPTRSLLASLKKDIRQTMRVTASAGKPLKKK